MNKDLVLLDGAVGTSLWEKTDDKVPVWRYNIEKPDIVSQLINEYYEAGSKIILANTFSANGPSVADSGYTVEQIVSSAMEIAHGALDGKDAKIALSVGPLTGLLKPFGNISEEEAVEIFTEQIEAGVKGKPDVIFLQTFMDLKMMQIAARIARKHDIPLFCSFSFVKSAKDKGSRTMMGNSIDDILKGLAEFKPDAVGLNCSLGPEMALPIIEEYSQKTDIPLIFKPNAGKPTLEGGSQFDYDTFAEDIAKAACVPGIKYIGGCCGSNAKYIEALRKKCSL